MNRTWAECSAFVLAFLPAPFDHVRFNTGKTKGILFGTSPVLSTASAMAYISQGG